MRCSLLFFPLGLLLLGGGCEAPTTTTLGSTAQSLSVSEGVPVDETRVIGPAYDLTSAIVGASSPDGYLLSWCKDNHRVAARFDTGGSQLDDPPQWVSDRCNEAQVAYSDSGYLIVQLQGNDLLAEHVDLAGQFGQEQTAAFDAAAGTQFQLIAGPSGFLIGYSTLQRRFVARRLASDGLPLDRTLVGDEPEAWLAATGNDYVLAWKAGDKLVAKRCPTDQEPDLSSAIELSKWVSLTVHPAIALAFVGDRLILSRPGYGVELFDSELSSLGEIRELADVIPAEHPEFDPYGNTTTFPTAQTITALGDRALLMWADANSTLKAVIIDPAKGTSVAQPITVTETRNFHWAVNWSVTNSDDGAAIAWSGLHSERPAVWHTNIDSAGQLGEEQALFQGPNQQFIRAAVATNSGALATWMEWRDGSYRAFACGVSPAGEPQGESHKVFASATGREDWWLAGSGTQALAVWNKDGFGMSWQLLEPSGEPVGELFSAPGRFAKGVASTGASFVVAEMDPVDLNMRLTLLGPDGREEKRVRMGTHSPTNCAIAAGDQYLVACVESDLVNVLRFDDDLNVVGSAVSRLPDELRYTSTDSVQLTRGAGDYLLTFNVFGFSYAARLSSHGKLLDVLLELGQPASVNTAFDGSGWVLALDNQLVRLNGNGEPEQLALEGAADDSPVLLTPTCSGETLVFYQTGDDVSRVVTSRLSANAAPNTCGSDETSLGGGGCSVLPAKRQPTGAAWIALGVLAMAVGWRRRRALRAS